MKKILQNSLALLTLSLLTTAMVAQTPDTSTTKFDQAIAQEQMLFEDYNSKIDELKAMYRVDLTDFEKEDLTDKIWYYELQREVAELKIKFLNKEADYANGVLERPNYYILAEATVYIEETDPNDQKK